MHRGEWPAGRLGPWCLKGPDTVGFSPAVVRFGLVKCGAHSTQLHPIREGNLKSVSTRSCVISTDSSLCQMNSLEAFGVCEVKHNLLQHR